MSLGPGRRPGWSWKGTGRFLALFALSIGAHLFAALVLAVVPLRLWADNPSAPRQLLESNTIVEYFSRVPIVFGLLLLGSFTCLAIARMQRGQEDRVDGLALWACALALPGGWLTFVSTNIAAQYNDYRPMGLMRLGVVLLAASSLISLIALLRLLFQGGRRKGRMLSLYVFVWAGYFSACTYGLVLHPRCPQSIPPGWELPVVKRASDNSYYFLPNPDEPIVDVSVDRDGVTTLDGVVVWRPSDGESEHRLRAALVTAAKGLSVDPKGGSEPNVEAPLHLRADARAPCSTVVRLLELCAEREVRIWKFMIHVSRAPYLLEGTCDTYRLSMYAARRGREGELPKERLLLLRPPDDGSSSSRVTYEYLGQRSADAAATLSRMKAAVESLDGESLLRTTRVSPELSWGAAIDALARLRDAQSPGALGPLDSRFLEGLELLEE